MPKASKATASPPQLPPLVDFGDNEFQRQVVFSSHKFTAGYGGRGNGKTTAGADRTIMLAEIYPGNSILVARQTYSELLETSIKVLQELIAKRNGGIYTQGPYVKRYVAQPPEGPLWELRNGTVIRGRSLDKFEKKLGPEYGSIWVDQAEETEHEVIMALEGGLRWWTKARAAKFKAQYGYHPRHFMTITGNPAPGWVHDKWKLDKTGTYHMIEASSEANRRNLHAGYIEHMRRTYPANWVSRFIDGEWDVMEGQIWGEFDEKVHVVPQVHPKAHWEHFIALDHGHRNATCVLWGAVDEHGNIHIYQEHYQAGWLVEQHAARIHSLSKGHFVSRTEAGDIEVWGDPAIEKNSATAGKSIWEEYLDHGVSLMNANNDVPAGLLRVGRMLHSDPDHTNPYTRVKGAPRLYISRAGCPQLIHFLPRYRYQKLPAGAPRDGVEKPLKKDDHAPDSLRYLVQAVMDSRPDAPKKRTGPIDPAKDFMLKVLLGKED